MTATHEFFATCPKGIEPLLAEELRALGARAIRETRAGVAFEGVLATAYRACLWSRLASRVLLRLAQFPAASAEALYAGVQQVPWAEHLHAHGTLAVDFTGSGSGITHSHFGALKVKDAIVDQLRAPSGRRPSVDTDRPDVRINVYLHHDTAVLSLDLSGEALHRRGYRRQAAGAPLKENLAAAILLRAGWPAIAAQGGAFVDLMCGSGTLPIEAALIAGDIAPGLTRHDYGFLRWRQHEPALWDGLIAEAEARRATGLARLPPIRGYDREARAVREARENVAAAGLSGHIGITRRELSATTSEPGGGLVVVNPPYGERLGEPRELPALYAELGAALKKNFPGWRAAVLTGHPELGKHLGLRARRYHTLFNGAIACRLLHVEITPENHAGAHAPKPFEIRAGSSAEMFANRLRKDLQHFGRWARRQGISCYRLYDADLHEYNLAIDVYESDQRYAHVQEYEAPDTIRPDKARQRRQHALGVIPVILEIPREQMFFKVRRRQRGGAQYEKLGESGEFHEVREGPCRFLVNFTDYLDTGLFLDHRDTRALLGALAKEKRFLNLFGYTGTATVRAALGGAVATTTVDMSRPYLDWARRNFALNGMNRAEHELIQADVLAWLRQNRSRRYGLVFLDPPTFSRSKRMQQTFDVQRDHAALIADAAALLEPGGILIFSTNLRKFKIDRAALAGLTVEDITRRTIPKDFERDPKVHQCFRITRK
jgi:23S rRNA (guanine2445-N2)-methyltransferase / 23S rRNA (guanine2069-N7)-methyltransferase